jgi:hypothetical protein
MCAPSEVVIWKKKPPNYLDFKFYSFRMAMAIKNHGGIP